MSWLHDVAAWVGGALVALAATMGLGGNGRPLEVQGYVEGEYVYVGSPVAGRLQTLDVAVPLKRYDGATIAALCVAVWVEVSSTGSFTEKYLAALQEEARALQPQLL